MCKQITEQFLCEILLLSRFIAKHFLITKTGQVCQVIFLYIAISRKVVGKNVHATIPKGDMGYFQYTVADTVAVEPTFVAFL